MYTYYDRLLLLGSEFILSLTDWSEQPGAEIKITVVIVHYVTGQRERELLTFCVSTGTGMVNCSGRWVKTNKRINNDNNSYQSCQLVAHCLQTIAQWCWWLVWGCRVDVQSSALSCLSLRPLSATDNNLSPSSKNYFINFIKK